METCWDIMITKGSIVKYLGYGVALPNAQRYMIDNYWRLDDFTTGALGICESYEGLSVQGYRFYKCRFPDGRNLGQHKTGNFFFFEIEEV